MIESIVLSFGTAFAAFKFNEQSSHDVQPFDVKGWFINKFESESAEKEEKVIEIGSRFKVYVPKVAKEEPKVAEPEVTEHKV